MAAHDQRTTANFFLTLDRISFQNNSKSEIRIKKLVLVFDKKNLCQPCNPYNIDISY